MEWYFWMNEFNDESKMKRFNFKRIYFIDGVQYFFDACVYIIIFILTYMLYAQVSVSYLEIL